MHSVIQHYTSSPSFTDELKKRMKDLESDVSSVPGFIAFYCLKTADGGVIVTVCDERFGCDEATRRTANFIKKNLPNLKFSTPQTLGGEVSFKFANYKTTKV
jgi:hypothetical protein